MINIVVLPSARLASDALARFLAEALTATPDLVLGLPTGRTPVLLYRALVEQHRAGRADFSRATTFNLDEFAGLDRADSRGYRAFMRRHLFDHVNLPPERTHLPDGSARRWRIETASYEQRIAKAGGLDLVVVGIGGNGHVGFNEPAPALEARTHRARLTRASRVANAYLFGGRWQDVPTHALSMGMGTILGARGVVLLATGRHKAAIVARALTGPITTRVPASLLQVHPNALVVLDRAAATRLPRR
jgi:glucosamine-6-phosphate deaminase